MRKLFFIMFFLGAMLNAFAQRNTNSQPKPSKNEEKELIPKSSLGRWSMNGVYGIAYFLGDVPMDGIYAAYGGSLKYSFSHIFGIRTQFMHGKVTGSPITIPDKTANIWFTNVTSSLTTQFIFNIGGINFRKSFPKNNFYVGFGGGILFNRARRDFVDVNLGYAPRRETVEFTLPIVFGYKRKLNKNFDLGIEGSYYVTTDDDIDLRNVGRFPDGYGYSGLTLTYNITTKNRPNHIDWFNPIDNIYKRIENAKKEAIDLAKQDDDGDGIPNFMDEEPKTPKGYKVDNKGKTLDSDEDGIPDSIDEDPFGFNIALNKFFPDAKDNVMGKQGEIYQINDSVPQVEFVTIAATGAGLPLITFPPNSFTVHVEQYPLLQVIARIMIVDTTTSLVIIGHADNNRDDITQLTLSEKRALEVKRKLAKIYELEESRILVFSERDPYIKKYNLGTEGLNRKVEFRILRPKSTK